MKTTQKHTQLFALSALTSFTLLLSACGGGGSTPAPAPNLPVISQAAATDAVSFAKSGNALVINHLVSNSDLEGSLLAVMTGANILSSPTPTTTASSNCGVSGTTSYVFLKTKFGAGLNAGDYIESIYANCVQVAGGVAFNGTSRDTALTNTTADVSAAGATFALPFTWTATNYRQLSTSLTSTFNGVVNFTTYSYNPNGTRSIVANTNATG